MTEISDIRACSSEILDWKRTGILNGDALRSRARAIQEKFGNSFDMGEALSHAEKEIARELMEAAVAEAAAAKPPLIPEEERGYFVEWLRGWVSRRYGVWITYRTAYEAFVEFHALRKDKGAR